jgi:hypothetical protein
LNNLGLVELDAGRLDEAEAWFRLTMETYDRSMNDQDSAVRVDGSTRPPQHMRIIMDEQGGISSLIESNLQKVQDARNRKQNRARLIL